MSPEIKNDKRFHDPSYLVIGSQKSGTSMLHYYLEQHPEIRPCKKKEIHYFDKHFNRGLEWYRSHFPPAGMFPSLITGEASPYYMFHPLVPQRVFDTYPDIKLIAILKNPVDRAYSQYQHNRRRNRAEHPFEEALTNESRMLEGEIGKIIHSPGYVSKNHMHYSYIARGIYIEQFKRWAPLFPLESFKIIDTRELFASPQEVMNDLFRFLERKPFTIKVSNRRNHDGYPPMKPETREQLSRFFEPFNRQLYDFLGRDFQWEKERSGKEGSRE